MVPAHKPVFDCVFVVNISMEGIGPSLLLFIGGVGGIDGDAVGSLLGDIDAVFDGDIDG